ncbi:hypothetical protein EVAR_62564_1 [Eumeta japonica]|uniref:Uncharacterized protein n=1 Tax=Eumeta variegata TaxID=151549 RepID=A0A4C1YMW0_EUMVA|nr:hypothetical protein EVAR_62564_1 [Eumeta japonica]
MCRVTWRDAAASNFVAVIASIYNRSTSPLAAVLVAVSTNVTVDPSSSNACVSSCPIDPITHTGTIFKNAHDANGFCVCRRQCLASPPRVRLSASGQQPDVQF